MCNMVGNLSDGSYSYKQIGGKSHGLNALAWAFGGVGGVLTLISLCVATCDLRDLVFQHNST